jgi:hypothetical protein
VVVIVERMAGELIKLGGGCKRASERRVKLWCVYVGISI